MTSRPRLFPSEENEHVTKPPDDWKPDEGVVLHEFDARPFPSTRAKFMASEVHEGPTRFPVRTELTVLPVDDPNVMTLGFTFREREGGPVGVPVDGKFHSPLLAREDLWEGREVLVPTLAGARHAVVARELDGTLYWRAGNMVGDLVFDRDDRHCWTTSYAKVELPLPPEVP